MTSLDTNEQYRNFNLVKCLLAVVGLVFDFGFLLQHYWLYRRATEYDHKKQAYGQKRQQRDEVQEKVQSKLE